MEIEATEENTGSLDALTDLAKRTLDTQNSQASALDGKAGFVFGSASILTGAIVAFEKSAFDTVHILHGNLGDPIWLTQTLASIGILFGVAVTIALYLRVVHAAYEAYKLVEFRTIAISDDVRDKFLSNNPLDTKVLFLDEMIRAVDANKIVLVEKRKEADIAVSSLIIEARIVAAVLAVQVLFLVFVQLYGG